MQVKLTIGERLKDLRVAKKLTLEQLSTEVGISKSALGKYESDNGKDISPYSISMLADYYGVSSDYLMGRTETKNHPNTALHELHLSDASIDVYTFTSFSGQSDFAAQKSCDCAVAHITKSACPTAAKSVCCHTLPHRRVCRQPLFRVSGQQRYNTLDFAKQNRVPTGMFTPLLETQRQRGAGLRWRPQSVKRFEALTEPTGETSLCNPSFSSRVHIQTAKGSLQCLL